MNRNTTIILTGTLLVGVIIVCTFFIIESQKKMMAAMNSMNNGQEPNFNDEKETEESEMTVEEERNPIGFKIPEKKA